MYLKGCYFLYVIYYNYNIWKNVFFMWYVLFYIWKDSYDLYGCNMWFIFKYLYVFLFFMVFGYFFIGMGIEIIEYIKFLEIV